MYEPKSSSITWGFVHFLGGAALGQYPQVCYDAFLSAVSERTGDGGFFSGMHHGDGNFTSIDGAGEEFAGGGNSH